jgi:hypothetical protein
VLPEKPLYILPLPIPHKKLRPNSKCNPYEKLRIIKKNRRVCYLLAMMLFGDIVNKFGFKPYKKAQIKQVFYFKDKRTGDEDNAEASTKSSTDGVCDSRIIQNDKGIHWLEREFIIDKSKAGKMEYHFYSLSD